jgi:hypothetical protein
MGVRPVYRMRPIAYCPMFKPGHFGNRPCFSPVEHIAPQSVARKAELPRPLTALPAKTKRPGGQPGRRNLKKRGF